MLFNSFVFVGFYIIVYIFYVCTSKKYKLQNILLLVVSYIFYGYWDWRFLSLLWISTIVDFTVGKRLYKCTAEKNRKLLLACSIIVNLSLLGFFKYFNFFSENFERILNCFGLHADPVTLNIVLPVGISFYTFQTMSYTIDIYRNKLVPTNSFIDFALFVAFFPQLVAGPIERAKNLLPQISGSRKITADKVNAGLFLILWGYYKKLVIADNLAIMADTVFNSYLAHSGLDLLLGVLAFTVQIYCDFSGYSDIARGLAKLMGFEIMVNFKLPYFALNPSDFWNRWHVSLSSWLRDYLYFSLGGNRKGKIKTYRNLSLTMLLGGLWHGAAWNFVIWGAYHGLILILYRIFDKTPEYDNFRRGEFRTIRVLIKICVMFILTIIGWIIFRSTSIAQILYFFTHIGPQCSDHTFQYINDLLFFSLPLIVIQIIQYFSQNSLIITKIVSWKRIPIYGFLLAMIVVFGVRNSTEFIYFQF